MKGQVTTELEALLPLVVFGSDRVEVEVQAVLDTGFNGFVALPPAVIESLHLTSAGAMRAVLANGDEVVLERYLASVRWDGVERQADVLEVHGGPLIGMLLMEGHRLEIDVRPGGGVSVTPSAG